MRDCPKMSDKLTQALRNQSNGLFNADTMLSIRDELKERLPWGLNIM